MTGERRGVPKQPLDALFAPQSVVVVGASENPGKIGGRLLYHLLRYGFSGRVHVVNANRPTVQGVPAYRSVDDLPTGVDVDLAVIATPAASVPHAVAEVARRGAACCVVVSSGFAELGESGRRLEDQLTRIAAEHSMRVLGPNCQGVANLAGDFVACFSSCFAQADVGDGPVAIISQSGAVAAILTELQLPYVPGVRYWASTGNECDVGVTELVRYVIDDPGVRAVEAYVEEVSNAPLLAEAGEVALRQGRAILLLKAGTTAEGRRAADSHTGALAQEDAVVDAFLHQHGIVRVRDVVEMAHLARVFTTAKRPAGRGVAVVSNSGGLGVMMTDECVSAGLRLARFSSATRQALTRRLPSFAAVGNPVDVTAELLTRPELVRDVLAAVAADPGVDAILLGLGILGDYYDVDGIAADIVEAGKHLEQVIAVCWLGGRRGMVEYFCGRGIPAFADATACVHALARYAAHAERVEQTAHQAHRTPGWAAPGGPGREAAGAAPAATSAAAPAAATIASASVAGSTLLSEHASKELARRWGLPVVRGELAATVDEAVAAARRIGYPVVAKLSAAELQHKTERGLVHVGIADDSDMAEVSERILQAAAGLAGVDGVLVEELVDRAVEALVGIVLDPVFGATILVGAGGVHAELLSDWRMLFPPLSEAVVAEALRSLRLFPLLNGYRGRPRTDVDALIDLVLRLAAAPPVVARDVLELDFNPVFVLQRGRGVRIADASIRLAGVGGRDTPRLAGEPTPDVGAARGGGRPALRPSDEKP